MTVEEASLDVAGAILGHSDARLTANVYRPVPGEEDDHTAAGLFRDS